MGFFKKIKKAVKKLAKVAKVVAPIAAGFIPGGSTGAALLRGGLGAVGKLSEASGGGGGGAERGPSPDQDLGQMIAGNNVQNRMPSPMSFASPGAAQLSTFMEARKRALGLLRIAKGKSASHGQKIRANLQTRKNMGTTSKQRLRFRYNRGPMHGARGMNKRVAGTAGPTAKWKALRGSLRTRVVNYKSRRGRRSRRKAA